MMDISSHNLLQLASVSEAVLKLNTTDPHIIRDYIYKKNNAKYVSESEKQNIQAIIEEDYQGYSHKIFDLKSRRCTISVTHGVITNSSYTNPRNSLNRSYSTIDNNCLDLTFSSNRLEYYDNLNRNNQGMIISNLYESNNKTSSNNKKCLCTECGKKYSTSSNLARHRQIHKLIVSNQERICPHCNKSYISMPAYWMHLRTHSKGYECEICSKIFSRPWLLQGHIRTHTGEKPFICVICNKAFADKSNLRAHTQTHSNIKPYSCPQCGKSFALKSYLCKHKESVCKKRLSCDEIISLPYKMEKADINEINSTSAILEVSTKVSKKNNNLITSDIIVHDIPLSRIMDNHHASVPHDSLSKNVIHPQCLILILILVRTESNNYRKNGEDIFKRNTSKNQNQECKGYNRKVSEEKIIPINISMWRSNKFY